MSKLLTVAKIQKLIYNIEKSPYIQTWGGFMKKLEIYKIGLVLITLLTSCGKLKIDTKPIKVENPGPVNVYIGPDFKAAADFCDQRYGFKTSESESCFLDFRNYLSISVDFNEQLLNDYCNGRFVEQSEIEQCQVDFEEYFNELGE